MYGKSEFLHEHVMLNGEIGLFQELHVTKCQAEEKQNKENYLTQYNVKFQPGHRRSQNTKNRNNEHDY